MEIRATVASASGCLYVGQCFRLRPDCSTKEGPHACFETQVLTLCCPQRILNEKEAPLFEQLCYEEPANVSHRLPGYKRKYCYFHLKHMVGLFTPVFLVLNQAQ